MRRTSIAIGALLATAVMVAVVAGLWRSTRAPSSPSPSAAAHTIPRGLLVSARADRAEGDGVLAGRVLGPDGAGLAGAAVVAQRRLERQDRAWTAPRPVRARSANDGSFRFDDLAPGNYSVAATAPGLLGAARDGMAIAASAPVTGVELRLSHGGVTLSGRVKEASGGMVPGAQLFAEQKGVHSDRGVGSLGVFTTETAPDGRYSLQLVPGRYHVYVSADGYTRTHTSVTLSADETCDLVVEPAAHIRGRVVRGEGGTAVEGAEVAAEPDERGLRSLFGPVITDANGAFHIDELPPAGYRLTARNGNLVGRTAQRVLVASAAAVEDVIVALAEGASVTGTVKSEAGAPIAGAEVQVWPTRDAVSWSRDLRVKTDERGRYQIAGLLPGQHGVSAKAERFGGAEARLEVSGPVTQDLVLAEAARLSAVVLDTSGLPVPGAQIEATTRPGQAGAGRSDYDSGVTDAQGRFRFKPLEAGVVTINACRGEDIGRTGPAPLAPGTPAEMTVRLVRGARIRGKVAWDDGIPAANIDVEAHGKAANEDIFASARTGRDGSFSLGPLFAGQVELAARTQGDMLHYAGDDVPVMLTPGEQRSGVVLTLARRNVSIRGQVVGPAGRPAPGVEITAARDRDGRPGTILGPIGGGDGRALTGADGAFTVEGLAPGSFTVRAHHPDHPELVRPAVAAGTRDLRLRLERPGTVAGVVVMPDGAPVTSFDLVVSPSGLDQERSMTRVRLLPRGLGEGIHKEDPRGAFRFDRLAAGSYDVAALLEDGRVGEVTGVKLAEGEIKQGLRLVVNQVTGRVQFR
jgi:protocatechuate 3,4-dioxygenase beta subunit